MPGVDEFAWIASLRHLTRGDPRALALDDDVACVPARPGYDLIVSKDAMVEGVHFLENETPDVIARRLLRVSLSDLAAKAAEPFGYLMMCAFPPGRNESWREAFAQGLDQDGRAFGVALLGGDTVSTSGPMVVSATVFGWVRAGAAVLRSGARAGDRLIVCGDVGAGWLGLKAARGEIADPTGTLAARYRLPSPLLALRGPLEASAEAAADVSDGLLADASHVAIASGLGFSLDLAKLPLSREAVAWLQSEADSIAALLSLVAGGDDYAIVAAVAPERAAAFQQAVAALGTPVADCGAFEADHGMRITFGEIAVEPESLGWRHQDPT